MRFPQARFHDLEHAGVLITGGGSGIGAALVEGFAIQGAKVAFLDKAETESRALVEALRERGLSDVSFFPVDLADIAATQKAVEAACLKVGPLRVVVNNAGWDDRHDIDTVTGDYWDANQAVNLRQVFFVTQAAVQHLRAAGGGSVVNMSSIAFRLNMGDIPSYAAAKAGIVGLTKSLAGRLGPEGIRVNAILPGMIVTERQKKLWLTEGGMAAMIDRQCLKRALEADAIVGPALFLASGASAAITAQTLTVDGGVL